MIRLERHIRVGCVLGIAMWLAACGGDGGRNRNSVAAQTDAARESSARVGDLVVRASAVPTISIGEAVARQYGIERDAGSVLLLAGVRRGEDVRETSVSARVTATATDLLGKRQQIAMREIRSGAFIDYVGTATVIAPDTLRFDLQVLPESGRRIDLRFNRDFFAL